MTEPDTAPERCKRCGGTGTMRWITQHGNRTLWSCEPDHPGSFACPLCQGTGTT